KIDPVIWEGEESRIRSLQPTIAEIEERLDMLSPDYALPDEEELENQLETIISLCLKPSKAISSDNIPINHIRRATAWMHMTTALGTGSGGKKEGRAKGGAGSSRKIVIIENADKMYDASSNSLLKLLEEPPPDVYLILITTRKGAMIPTVLSRLRPYAFVDRDSTENPEILKRIFQEEAKDYQSLREYFLYWKELNPEQLKVLARRFIDAVLSRSIKKVDGAGPVDRVDILEEMKLLFSTKSPREFLFSFIEELLIHFHSLLKQGLINPFRMERWNRIVRKHYEAMDRFNQNAN
ncbi:unnamed protein product, partial [marine sediment metagenome]